MEKDELEFRDRVAAVLLRWWRQQGQTAPAREQVAAFSGRLFALVERRGLPDPLPPGEAGTPGGLPEDEARRMAAEVQGDLIHPLFEEAARQLVKTCFYPEFRICRDSFCETGGDGICRRQQVERTRRRLSGVHCVDCPHWTDLSPEDHVRFLTAAWHGDPAEFHSHRDIFLPEDFRALRIWLRARARRVA